MTGRLDGGHDIGQILEGQILAPHDAHHDRAALAQGRAAIKHGVRQELFDGAGAALAAVCLGPGHGRNAALGLSDLRQVGRPRIEIPRTRQDLPERQYAHPQGVVRRRKGRINFVAADALEELVVGDQDEAIGRVPNLRHGGARQRGARGPLKGEWLGRHA